MTRGAGRLFNGSAGGAGTVGVETDASSEAAAVAVVIMAAAAAAVWRM